MLKVALFSIAFLNSIETTHYIQTYKIFINKCKRYVIFFYINDFKYSNSQLKGG